MDRLLRCLEQRYGSAGADLSKDEADLVTQHEERLLKLADRRSHRRYDDRPVSVDLLKLLAGVALAAPSKSDLQQRDIVIVNDPGQVSAIKAIVADQDWIEGITALLVFCGNNRRQRQMHEARAREFANDHLDAFFNAAVDAGIALQAFITAAETIGLGCCPISAIRNDSDAVATILELPNHTFPVAGLGVGWPAWEGRMSLRLPLETTVHVDRFDDSTVLDQIAAYERRRAREQPFRSQRGSARFGTLPPEEYTWSEDKTRQYAEPERSEFGRFVVSKGFHLV